MATDRETFKVYLTQAEAALVRQAAGTEAVSGFIRRTLMNNVSGEPAPERVRELGNKIAGQLAEFQKPVSEQDEQVSGRTGHEPGCECFQCTQTRRFLSPPKKKEKEEKPKKGRR